MKTVAILLLLTLAASPALGCAHTYTHDGGLMPLNGRRLMEVSGASKPAAPPIHVTDGAVCAVRTPHSPRCAAIIDADGMAAICAPLGRSVLACGNHASMSQLETAGPRTLSERS
jgi:hypothetical protein